MNNTKTPTAEKVMFPLRLPPDMYKEIREIVYEKQKNGKYGYSTNDCLTEIIEKGLKEKNNERTN